MNFSYIVQRKFTSYRYVVWTINNIIKVLWKRISGIFPGNLRTYSLNEDKKLLWFQTCALCVSAVTIISGAIMFILFVSELQYYLTKEVSSFTFTGTSTPLRRQWILNSAEFDWMYKFSPDLFDTISKVKIMANKN